MVRENRRMKSDIIVDMIFCLSICLLAAVIPICDALKLSNAVGMNEEHPFEIRGQVKGIAKDSFSIMDDSGHAFIHKTITNEIAVGDIVTVWVLAVDVKKGRISLTMKKPTP